MNAPACPFFRVYRPYSARTADITAHQIGKYIVAMPDMDTFNGGEPEDSRNDGTVFRLAVVDDFGNLRGAS